MGHMAVSELSPRGGRARSHGIHGSTRAHLDREARSGAEGHVTAPEPTSDRRRDPGLRNTWQCWSSALGEAEPGAMGHMAELEPTSVRRRGLGP
jgi:hypothetical protein